MTILRIISFVVIQLHAAAFLLLSFISREGYVSESSPSSNISINCDAAMNQLCACYASFAIICLSHVWRGSLFSTMVVMRTLCIYHLISFLLDYSSGSGVVHGIFAVSLFLISLKAV